MRGGRSLQSPTPETFISTVTKEKLKYQLPCLSSEKKGPIKTHSFVISLNLH